MNETIGVIIPTYKPDAKLKELLRRLQRQSRVPDEILLINTEESFWDPALAADFDRVRIHHISKQAFDHGGTRNLGARLIGTDIMVFMTMDALPADHDLIRNLVKPLEDPSVAVSYARQLAGDQAGVLERYTRNFNYGPESRIKRKEDLGELGIKTYFCSDVCAAYKKDLFEKLGAFPDRTIFNEDMIFAGHAVQAGYAVSYTAQAKVIHSHNYSGPEQLRRNFDLGVSQAQHPEVFSGISSESEGIRMLKSEASWLWKQGHALLIPKLIWQSGCKYVGFRLGKAYRRLPRTLILKLTGSREYWEKD